MGGRFSGPNNNDDDSCLLSPNTSSTAKARLAFRGCEVGETSSQKRNQGGGSQEQEAKGTVDINRITKKEERSCLATTVYTLCEDEEAR